jgi:hypothetical protein
VRIVRKPDAAADEVTAEEDGPASTPVDNKLTAPIRTKTGTTDPDIMSLYLYNGARDPDLNSTWFQVEEESRESQQQAPRRGSLLNQSSSPRSTYTAFL